MDALNYLHLLDSKLFQLPKTSKRAAKVTCDLKSTAF